MDKVFIAELIITTLSTKQGLRRVFESAGANEKILRIQ